jgi:cystathionine beta-lyase
MVVRQPRLDFDRTETTSGFDRVIERRGTDSIKWSLFEPDVLPMWVADMDFPSPPEVVEALRKRVNHGVFGYASEPEELRELVVDRLARAYGWCVAPEALMFLPNVCVGFNLVCQALARPGNGLLIQPPVYFPILQIPENAHLKSRFNELTCTADGRYEIDFESFEREAKRSRVFVLCNPHNPVSRVFRRDELERMAETCVRHDVIVCSDEIHADFVYDGRSHVPIASLGREIERRSVTLIAPNKTYNVAGVPCAIAVVPNEEHRRAIESASRGLVAHVGIMGLAAAVAAYKHGEPWAAELLSYLEANRNAVSTFVAERLPGVRLTPVEGTYLAWLDCREAVTEDPHEFFLREGRIALNAGSMFGPGGSGFVRLNFACPRATLMDGLERMRRASAANAG